MTETTAFQQLDWAAVHDEACELLCSYIRYVTTNDPDRLDPDIAMHEPWRAGSEAEAIAWLERVLRSEGIETEVLEAAPGRANLIARIPGCEREDPVILLSHADVVPADNTGWLPGIDPFAAVIRDGYIYGRGALDLKGLGIAHVMSVLLLQRCNIRPRRDVVLLVVADEEAGGHYGAEWLLQARPDLRRACLVLGEGAYSLKGWKTCRQPLHAISVAEKGYLELELRCEAIGQHASMPEGLGAAERLTRALDRVLKRKCRARLTPPTCALLQHLGECRGGMAGWLLQHPGIAARLGLLDRSHGPIIDAMLRDTVALTILEAGYKSNVLPNSARAVLSIRLLPGTDPNALTEDIRCAAEDSKIEIRRMKYKEPNSSAFDTMEYSILERVAGADGASVVPILSPGASDCRFWRAVNAHCYGWIPFTIEAHDLHSIHGANERVSVQEFGAGIERFFDALVQLVTF